MSIETSLTRRQLLQRLSCGFGSVALSELLCRRASAVPQLPARAKSVILCYMSGAISHIDSFDPKPLLKEMHGKPMPMPIERTQFNNNGQIFGSPFSFPKQGQCGIPVSDIFPKIGECIDEITVVRSLTTSVSEHAQGNFMAHTGFPFLGHPGAGAWVSYGLGSANENLPSYVVLQSGGAVPPHGGVGLFSNGFLPAQHQASILKADQADPVANIRPSQASSLQRTRLNFVEKLDQDFSRSLGGEAQIEAAIKNYETAFRMQSSVPEICDLSGESEVTRQLYGIDDPNPTKSAYAKQALLARRLVEQGVRFVELSCLTEGIGAGGAANPWDQHSALEKGHRAMANQVDQPIAALLKDLKGRGMLDETLVIFTGEFGRTPFSQGSDGRDHNPFGFSAWLAGGGIQGGTLYGATDEFGYRVVDRSCTFYDLWATVLYQLGIDHQKLTYRYAGRDVRLTDVHGHVLHGILT